MFDGSANSPELLSTLLNLLERPDLSSMKPLQTISDLLMSTLLGGGSLKDENSGKRGGQTLKHDAESMDGEDRQLLIRRYLSTKKMLLDYKENGS